MSQSVDGQNSERNKAWRLHRSAEGEVNRLLNATCTGYEWAAAIKEFNRTWREYMKTVNAEIPAVPKLVTGESHV